MTLATPPDFVKPGLLVRSPAREVERVDRQHDVVQTEGGEGEIEHESRCLGAESLAATGRVTDEDPELGATMPVVAHDDHNFAPVVAL